MSNNSKNVPLTMKKAYNRVGLSMLVFYGVLSVVSVITTVAALAIAFFGRGGFSADWLRELTRGGISDILNNEIVTDAVLYASVAGSLLGFPIGLLVMKAVLPKFKQEPEKRDLTFGQMIMIFIMGYGLWGVGAVLGNLPSFFGIEMISDFTEGASTTALIVYTLYAVIGAPILEELVFRKTLLARTHGYGQVVAVFVTALLFGLIHGNPAQFPLAFMLGLLLGTVYVKTGRILYTMLMHFMINFTASIPELVYYISGADISGGWNVVIPVLIVLGLVFVIVFRKHDLLKLKRSYNPKANPDTFKNVGMILAIVGGGVLVVSSVGLSILENVRYNGLAALWILVPIAVSVVTIILVPLTVGRHYIVRVTHEPQGAAPSGTSTPSRPVSPQYGQPIPPQYGPQNRQPMPPTYGQPVPPQYGQPVPPQYGQPINPQYGQPVPPTYGQPVPPQYQPDAPAMEPSAPEEPVVTVEGTSPFLESEAAFFRAPLQKEEPASPEDTEKPAEDA